MSHIDRTLSALADPTRRQILAHLSQGELTVNALVSRFTLSQPTISAHLKVLERAGLITRERQAQSRPCRLAPEALRDLDHWLTPFRQRWESQYQRLDRLLDDLAEEEGSDAR